MAEAVAEAVDEREHLLVQAGTGTGKSLAYLVPALAHGKRVVVATATLALQRQLVAPTCRAQWRPLHAVLGRSPTFAMLKGRNNYLCRHRARGQPPRTRARASSTRPRRSAASGKLGQDVLRLRDWAEETETGDRDDLSPGVTDKAWAQVSVLPRVPRRRAAAPTARSASPSRPGSGPSWPTWWSPTTRCWRSTRWRARRCCPSTSW